LLIGRKPEYHKTTKIPQVIAALERVHTCLQTFFKFLTAS